MSYYNTTESLGIERHRFDRCAKTQEQKILSWFLYYKRQATPSQLLKIFDGPVPITSVRRALTNLTNEGELEKTSRQKRGPYGRPEFIWRLAEKYNQGELF